MPLHTDSHHRRAQGLIQHKKLSACDALAASALCRRRLPVVLVRLKLAETMREAVSLIEQGHVRVGPDTVRQSVSATRARQRRDVRMRPFRHLTRADYHLMQTDADACAGVGHTCLIWQVSDPAYLVTRQMEDYVTWVDTSKVKRTVMKYNDKLDDFDLL